MKCSECGGQITSMEHLVYRLDGGSSGVYRCSECGRSKSWSIPGNKKEKTIDMS